MLTRWGWARLVRLAARLPFKFRVLCRQFMLRVIDLEALSIDADVTGYLGQFAGVAIMGSIIHSLIAFIYMASPIAPVQRLGYAWHFDQYLIATMMLVTGLFAIISWDSTFPDKRDIMVLAPLPISPRSILFAKLAASGAILGICILCLNVFSGFMWPFALGLTSAGWPGFFRTLAAYWITMIAATVFMYCAVLALQGFAALLLPRRLFLWASALLQLAVFGAIFGTYFLQGTLTSVGEMQAPGNQVLLQWSPSFWFFAFFNQIRGELPVELHWLAVRAWVGLVAAVSGALVSLMLCYLRTMRRTVEEPDLMPGSRSIRLGMRFGSKLQTAILQFTLRALTRSRQHRVLLAFYLSIAFAITLGMVRRAMAAAGPRAFSEEFPWLTSLIMVFMVMGFINMFSLPVSLKANWVLRTTQLHSTAKYFAATRNTLLLLSVAPACVVSIALGFTFRPITLVAAHLVALLLFGLILAEVALVGFHKIPFTCSLLPGNTNFQYVFWRTAAGVIALSLIVPLWEIPALGEKSHYLLMCAVMCAALVGLRIFNTRRSRSAVLYYEELPEELITSLKLVLPQQRSEGMTRAG